MRTEGDVIRMIDNGPRSAVPICKEKRAVARRLKLNGKKEELRAKEQVTATTKGAEAATLARQSLRQLHRRRQGSVSSV